MSALLTNPKIQIVAVCDPNKMSTNYVDWSPNGIRDGIRKTLGNPNWGEGINGIPGGRDIGQDFVESYYTKVNGGSRYKCPSYEDYRELLEKEKNFDAAKI